MEPGHALHYEVLRYIRAVLISKTQRKGVASLIYHQVSLNRGMKDRYAHDHDAALVESGLRQAMESISSPYCSSICL